VISIPDAGLKPAIIKAISDPVGSSRMLHLIDLDSGEPLEATHLLGLDRRVKVHSVTVEHHRYENVGSQAREVHLGDRIVDVAPGEGVHYTGPARLDLSGPGWVHTVEPIEVDREDRLP
jgi:hypothetical protein